MADVVITLYNNTEPVLKMTKTPTSVGSCTGNFPGEIDLLHPVCLVEADEATMEGANYFSLNTTPFRYFFIESKTCVRSGLWEIRGKADLRTTYAAAIQSSHGIIARNENIYDMYLNDGMIPVSEKKAIAIQEFPSTPFTHATGDGVRPVTMLVVGGE